MRFSHYPHPVTNEPVPIGRVDEDTIAGYHAWLDNHFPENYAENEGEQMNWDKLNNSTALWNSYKSWRTPWVLALDYSKKLIEDSFNDRS